MTREQAQARSLYGEALAAMEKQRSDLAAHLCEQAAALDPAYTGAVLLRAQIAFQARRWEVAERWYCRALNRDPANLELLVIVARCNIEMGAVGAAESLLVHADERGMSSRELVLTRALAHMAEERWEQAEKLLLQDGADVFAANAGTVLLLMLVGMVAPAIPAVVSSDDRRKSGS